MNTRERTLACLRNEPVDRLPVVHFGYWKETLTKWAKEGHISKEEEATYSDGNQVDRAICKRLGFDHCWSAAAGGNNFLKPPFEETVVKELPNGGQHVLTPEGVIELVIPGTTSIRSEIEHLLVDRESWEEHYKWRLQWDSSRVQHLDNFSPEGLDRPLGIWCGSLIGKIRNILGVEGLAYMGMDDPELLDEIVDTCGSLCLKAVEETLVRIDNVDYGHFWEDICYNHGPLVNPKFFADKIVPWYKRITDTLAANGVDLVSVDCDGCIDTLVPHWLEAGVNIMFPIEVGTWNASIAPWREQYGMAPKGIGGMRKNLFGEDRAAIDAEVERLRPLIALGGYIPCPDHRIPPDAKWELVQYYTEKIRDLRVG